MSSRPLVALSVLIFLACLPWDAFCQNGQCSSWPGWSILLFGWMSIPLAPDSLANLAWLANPALVVAWVATLAREKAFAIAASAVALALAASFMLARDVVTNSGGFSFPITGYRMGYWVWLASMTVALIAAIRMIFEKRPIAAARERPDRP
jgi:hypothetical protein